MSKEANIYKVGNATIIVNRPALTKQEREKREAVLLTALNRYGKEVMR